VLRIGTSGNEGDISVRDAANREVMQFDANFAVLRVGAAGNEGDVIVRDNNGNESIHLNGGAGDIILRNADAAEDFAVAAGAHADPGMVMAVASDGSLRPCDEAYDRSVVGVVAGAGRHRPGIILGRNPDARGHVPVSVMGKVTCRADANFGAIAAGDLLTSSPTPGHAMRVDDHDRARGAVIGKALSALDHGRGEVDLLISLQ
jgi:hypothetical protein